MKVRIITKAILILLSSLLYVALFKKGIDQIMVIAFLFAVIFIALPEILNSNICMYLFLFLFAAGGFWHIEFAIPACILIYGIISDNRAEKDLMELYFGNSKKTNYEMYRKIRTGMIIKIMLILFAIIIMCMAGYFNIGITVSIFIFCIHLLSLLLAIKDGMYNGMKRKYFILYDDTRLEAMDLKRQRREAFERNEEDVYMATLSERNRIAREIHDNVGHMLTRAIVQMQAIKIINNNEVIKTHLESVDETINQAMLNIRRSVHELHDDSVDLSVVVSECLKALPENIKPKFKTSIESGVPTDVKNTIIAIVRESITNIAKYSKGDIVYVEIIEHAAFWKVMIKDNGENEKKDYTPFLRDVSAENGLGLMGIYNRVKHLGGIANITSDKDGFKVLVTIPKN